MPGGGSPVRAMSMTPNTTALALWTFPASSGSSGSVARQPGLDSHGPSSRRSPRIGTASWARPPPPTAA
eukprot:15756316-Heterocapsa_arctica.AAC.1